MKALGEAALDLPWLSPCVASLTTLVGAPLQAVWPHLRTDPGLVLLLARAKSNSPTDHLFPASDLPLLEESLRHLQAPSPGFVDWNLPGPNQVYRACLRQAQLASCLAAKVGGAADRAWIGGLLAPLGWLAACALDPDRIHQLLPVPCHAAALALGFDHAAIARRLARCWHLPIWLMPLVGQLGLHVGIAVRLGADRILFQVVQLAVLLVQEREPGLGLPVGTSSEELLGALGLDLDDVEELTRQAFHTDPPIRVWEPPIRQPLLPDLLRLALENRRLAEGVLVEGLHCELDRMQEALEKQCAEELSRLQTQKLAALAEFAAGAGHEINNPLAVISGQAQYILKQLNLLDGPPEEIDDVGVYLENLKETVVPSLRKIVGQTQRIHGILTGVMQFARPPAPRPQPLQLGALIRDVAESLRELACERQVRLVSPEPDAGLAVEADPAQMRVALTCLLRNAIEAAPPEGWAGIRVERAKGAVEVLIEDSGQGPPPTVREHLFDPFFSGRSAGRGRGLGLSTAWRLARQHGGDVRFEAMSQGPTRFVLSLPLPPSPACVNGNGHHAEHNGRNGKNGAAV